MRVWVRGTAPRLDLQLLPPPYGGEEGIRWEGTRWVPSGGAGERSFGPRLLQLAEGLAELQDDPGAEPALAREAGRLRAALERIVLREGELTPERVREAFESTLREAARRELEPARRAPEEGGPLRESLQRFLAAAREIGRNDPALAGLGAGAGRALTSMEFLNAANALRQHSEQGAFLQIPYLLGGERGTMDVVVRGDREASKEGRQRESYSAVLLLELEGLGPLRVDAALVRNQATVRFTIPSEPVGQFLDGELPKLREAIESQQIRVERVSWAQGRVTPEPAVPVPPQVEGPEGAAPFIDLKV
ncbi:MAG: flagellar hook-length control protein FliK [Candidatus Tectomicrobia bacterium]|uniref:Flagellar hook-length control protein FliK n=1 Tax=Tectimicrobiota bacterium TaxID=2528274 RepID=A0A932ZTH0_UNCTE|nr:flagellar hook-length control protein FliK [Candidatus Tectomicrobia bacterium]